MEIKGQIEDIIFTNESNSYTVCTIILEKEIVYQSFLKKQEEKIEDSSQKEFSAKIPQNNKNTQKEFNKDNPFAGIQNYVNEK